MQFQVVLLTFITYPVDCLLFTSRCVLAGPLAIAKVSRLVFILALPGRRYLNRSNDTMATLATDAIEVIEIFKYNI